VRPPVFRGFNLLPHELAVDNFAGGGGASVGIEAAIGRPVDMAINHDPVAIAMHRANHPETRYFCEDIFEVDPVAAAAGRPIGLAWFSPDCRHFSKAKGTAPLKKEIRGLAWVVIRWAKAVKPRVILLENVEEFQTWGPLGDDGRPDSARMGETFREWLAELRACGYAVEFKTLVAADYGAPTTRKRLFLVARRDGKPIVWPAATHGPGRAAPHRSAAEIIDWSLPCRSIFGRKRPLAEATLKRIAAGLQKYVFQNRRPFIIPVAHQGDARAHSIGEPIRTITGSHRGEFALATPFMVRHGHYSTITGAGLHEGRGAGTFRGQPLEAPLGTVCATNDKHLVCPIITKGYGGPNGHQTPGTSPAAPIDTITARDHHGLAAAFLTKFFGTAGAGASVEVPFPTITAGGEHGGGHVAEVRAFLTKYYSSGGQGRHQNMDLFDPLHTVTSKARFGLVVIAGEAYQIVDIGLRMIEPHELFAATSFPEDYDIRPEFGGKPITKTQQTKLVGNAVCPVNAEALAAANVREAA